MILRPTRVDDVPAIVELYQAVAKRSGGIAPAPHEVTRAYVERLIDIVSRDLPEVTRIELYTQESNARALRLHESVGFRREGRMEGRIRTARGLEADNPMAWLRA